FWFRGEMCMQKWLFWLILLSFAIIASGFRPVFVRVFAWPSPLRDFLCDSRIRSQVDSNVVSGVFSWRRGSESNRRIKVLQTFDGQPLTPFPPVFTLSPGPVSVRFLVA